VVSSQNASTRHSTHVLEGQALAAVIFLLIWHDFSLWFMLGKIVSSDCIRFKRWNWFLWWWWHWDAGHLGFVVLAFLGDFGVFERFAGLKACLGSTITWLNMPFS
jgi:hypothetical protein